MVQPASKRLVTEARLSAVTPGDVGAATAAQGAKADTALQLTSTRPTVLLVGDSITVQCGRPSILDVQDAYSARGFFNWANWLMGERYNVVNVAGIGGQTSAQIAARIASDMAASPSEWVVLECGTNDVAQGRTYTDILASMTACLDAIQSAGRKCCILTVWPSNSHTTTAMKQIAAQVSQWIAALPLTRPGVVVADVYSVLVDPATGMLGAGMPFDSVHPGSAAAYRAGNVVANAMRPFAAPMPNMRIADTDPKVAIGNQSFLTSGAGWTLNVGTGATYARNPDGFGNMATATVAATGVDFGYLETLGTRINIGDVIQARARIRWSGLTWSGSITQFSPWISHLFRAASGSFNNAGSPVGSAGFEPSTFNTTFGASDVTTSGDVILTSTKVTIPALADDATAINRFYAKFGFRSTNLTGGTVTVSDVSVYKV
jgi:lysophospholipase L1-like esterase